VEVTPNPTMNTTTPYCSADATTGLLAIEINDELDILNTSDWTTFKMIF